METLHITQIKINPKSFYYILEDIDNANTTSTTVYYPASSGTKMYFKIKAYWQTSYGGDPIYSNLSSYKTVSF